MSEDSEGCEPYGGIVVLGDYTSNDLNTVCQALNKFEWFADDYDIYFTVSEDDNRRITFSSGAALRMPTIFPIGYHDDEGNWMFVEEDEEAAHTLEWLSKNVAPLLTSGTMEIVVAAGGTFEVYLHRLVIQSTGSVERHREQFTSRNGRTVDVERFSPKTKKRVAA